MPTVKEIALHVFEEMRETARLGHAAVLCEEDRKADLLEMKFKTLERLLQFIVPYDPANPEELGRKIKEL